MPFKDYTEFAEPLRLPYRGKVYEIPPVSARDGVTLIDALNPDSDTRLTRDEERRILLGDVLTEMEADGVPAAFVARCVLTAVADFQAGRVVAEAMWESGTDPKALERWMGARAAADSQPSTSTASATGTPSRASTTRTTSKRPARSSKP